MSNLHGSSDVGEMQTGKCSKDILVLNLVLGTVWLKMALSREDRVAL